MWFTHSQNKATLPRNSKVQSKDALMATSPDVGAVIHVGSVSNPSVAIDAAPVTNLTKYGPVSTRFVQCGTNLAFVIRDSGG
jgi:hypothetical protein